MLRKTLGAAAAALMGITMLSAGAIAQDATPAGTGDCAVTSPDENIAIVEQYFEAVLAGDTETADSLLHDDFQHDLSMEGAEVPNDAGNMDELENIGIAANVNHEVVATIAQGDWVAIDMEFDLTGADLGLEGENAEAVGRVEVVAIVRIECGMIAEATFTHNLLEVLMTLGYEVVPPGGA